jgi:hypothetical protein
MNRSSPFLIVGVLGIAAAMLAREPVSDGQAHAVAHPALMRAKLASSQKIVEGMMAQDFKLIAAGADELVKITDATEWQAEEDQLYAHYRADLRRTALKLSRRAEDENLEAVAYAYTHLLATCLHCHDHCRNVLHVAHDQPRLEAVPAPQARQTPADGVIRR